MEEVILFIVVHHVPGIVVVVDIVDMVIALPRGVHLEGARTV